MPNDLCLGLAGLIDPVPPSTFFRDYWEEKPLVISRGEQDYYGSLLSLTQLDSLMTSVDLPAATIEVVNADAAVERAEYVGPNGAIDILKVYQLFAGGSTILFQELQKWLPPLAFLCRAMEAEFSAPFQTNIYMTPAHGKGFKQHYDTHDVFVLQIVGAKEWVISGSPVRLPLRGQPFDSNAHASNDAIMSIVLRAGDVLYVPRGYLHQARSSDDISLHVTLGALSYTWAEVFLEVMSELCASDPAFRRALPVGFARPEFDPVRAREIFAGLLRRAAENAMPDATLERFADDLIATRRSLVPGQLAQISRLDKLAVGDEVGARPGLVYRLQTNGGVLRIRCHGREVSLPADAAEAVRFALANPRYSIQDLPGSLDDVGKLVLVRRLIAEGMLVCYSARLSE